MTVEAAPSGASCTRRRDDPGRTADPADVEAGGSALSRNQRFDFECFAGPRRCDFKKPIAPADKPPEADEFPFA
jgi:hypothetical protein